MAFASLSILGLYEWNTDIFANLVLPEGIDRDILIPEIVTECSDFPLLYPDYDFMKMLIGVWSQKELKIWSDLYRSENFQYNPIENYDRYEEITREISSESESTETASNTANETVNRTGNGTTSGTSTNSATAYNSITFQDAAKNTTSGTTTDTEQGTTANTASGSGSSDASSSGTETVDSHIHGNIGVKTAMAMIEEFRAVSEFCTYDYIVRSFKNRFCIQVY